MFDPTCMAAALAHELREQSRFPSGQPRISPEKAREIVAAALRSQPVEAVERVARAIWEAEPSVGHWCDWEDLSDDPDHHANLKLAERYRHLARAALASISQQPAPEVVEDAFKAGWQAAFDWYDSDSEDNEQTAFAKAIRSLSIEEGGA